MFYIPKEESYWPTISLDALFTSLITDAHEGSEDGISDVPGAYLNADMI